MDFGRAKVDPAVMLLDKEGKPYSDQVNAMLFNEFVKEYRKGRTIFVADAHRDDGRCFVVHADDKFTAFLELERAICLRLFSEQIKS